MEQKYYWVLGIVIVGISLISGCIQKTPTDTTSSTDVQSNTCEGLSRNFDAKINLFSATECDKWAAEGNKPIWVGGKLINISKIYSAAYERNEFTLTFQGFEKQGKIYIGTKEETIPYQKGKFYKFDLGNRCKLIFSAASSGGFSDPNLNALENLKECV